MPEVLLILLDPSVVAAPEVPFVPVVPELLEVELVPAVVAPPLVPEVPEVPLD